MEVLSVPLATPMWAEHSPPKGAGSFSQQEPHEPEPAPRSSGTKITGSLCFGPRCPAFNTQTCAGWQVPLSELFGFAESCFAGLSNQEAP